MNSKKQGEEANVKSLKESEAVESAGENSSSDLESKYLEYQQLEQQVKQLQKYIDHFDEQLSGVRSLVEDLKELESVKKGSIIYAPIANGIFVKAKIESASELLINVGNSVVVPKSIAEAVKLLEGQESEVQQIRSEAIAQLSGSLRKLEEIQ